MSKMNDWRKGDALAASHWQEGVDAIRGILGSGGAGDNAFSEFGYAFVVDKGPKNEANYTDERYWIKLAYLTTKDAGGANASVTSTVGFKQWKDPEKDGTKIVTAINLTEMGRDKTEGGLSAVETGTHALRKGRLVRYWRVMDGNTDEKKGPTTHFFMAEAPSAAVTLIQISGAATGAGWYSAKVWKLPTTAPDPTAALAPTALGTAGDDCYYANLSEIGKTTHDLTNAANTATNMFVGVAWGTATDGKAVYVSSGFYLEDCS